MLHHDKRAKTIFLVTILALIAAHVSAAVNNKGQGWLPLFGIVKSSGCGTLTMDWSDATGCNLTAYMVGMR